MEEIEPFPTGKVVMHTNYGPLEMELWCNECPTTCRSFLQLCLEGYYEWTDFHRLLPGFILQGGDPSGTGSGGQAANGGLLPLELHPRLRWHRRGLLGLATLNEAGEGGSQFFFTLVPAPDLNRTATLFGRIVGDTIYNLVRMGEVPVDGERPRQKITITRTEVITNPFDDIIPRELEEVRQRRQTNIQTKVKKIETKRPQPAAIRNKKILSFEEDGMNGEEPQMSLKTKIKSSHDVLDDPNLSKEVVSLDRDPYKKASSLDKHVGNEKDTWREELEQMAQAKRSNVQDIQGKIAAVQAQIQKMSSAVDISPNEQQGGQGQLPVSATRADSLAQLLGRRAVSVRETPSILEDQKNAYKERAKTIMGKRMKSMANEMDTLLVLNAFRDKLRSSDQTGRVDPATLPAVAPAKHLDICKLHGLVACQSCRDTFGGPKEEGSEEGWLMHRLVFDKDAGYREVRANLDQLKVIDPREREEQFLNKSK